MHLDAALDRVPHGAVGERREVEVGQELRVHPREQVLVEGRRDAERIVVGEQQLALRLDEIRAEQQRVARPQAPPDAGEKLVGGGAIEVADVRAEEEHEHRAVRRALLAPRGAGPPRTSRGGRPPRRARGAPRVRSESSRASGEMSIRWTRTRFRRLRRLSASIASFSPLPQPSSTKRDRVLERADHVGGKPREQAALGARDPVPRQPADRLEESRAQSVVEVLRLDLLRRRARGRAARPRRSRGPLRPGGAWALNGNHGADRPELGVHVRIVRAEPVAEAAAHELLRGRRRGALHDVVLSVEEVRRVLRDRTASARSPETARRPSTSTPSRCRRGPGRPTRSRRAGTMPPAPDPSPRSRSCRASRRAARRPRAARARRRPASRTPRGGTRPPSAAAGPSSARRRTPRRG